MIIAWLLALGFGTALALCNAFIMHKIHKKEFILYSVFLITSLVSLAGGDMQHIFIAAAAFALLTFYIIGKKRNETSIDYKKIFTFLTISGALFIVLRFVVTFSQDQLFAQILLILFIAQLFAYTLYCGKTITKIISDKLAVDIALKQDARFIGLKYRLNYEVHKLKSPINRLSLVLMSLNSDDDTTKDAEESIQAMDGAVNNFYNRYNKPDYLTTVDISVALSIALEVLRPTFSSYNVQVINNTQSIEIKTYERALADTLIMLLSAGSVKDNTISIFAKIQSNGIHINIKANKTSINECIQDARLIANCLLQSEINTAQDASAFYINFVLFNFK